MVVAIIALIVALAVPVISGFRERSEGVRCLRNLQQVGVALFAYAAEHNGQILPRALGHHRSKEDDKPPAEERPWPNRLILFGYAQNPDIFYCPSYTPKKNNAAASPLPSSGKVQTYGIRTWVGPGHKNWQSNPSREEHKPMALISEPADFFLVADSLWTHPAYRSQGYGIAPGMEYEQFVHLRHQGKANALFADGHVEAKPRAYFAELKTRQKEYTAGHELELGISEL